MATLEILQKLRALMKNTRYVNEPLAAYIIPTDDQHQSEYIADCHKRRQFISGFTGSAGVAMVTTNQALLWTDGRYHLQAAAQVDCNWTLMKQGLSEVPSIAEWLKKEMSPGAAVGFDPSLVSEQLYTQWTEKLDTSEVRLVAVTDNLVDMVWEDRPTPPTDSIFEHPIEFAGKSWEEKVQCVRGKMKEDNCSVLIVTALDDVAWLFNLRGSDIMYNPVFFSYGIVTTEDIRLFCDGDRLTGEAVRQLRFDETNGVRLFPYSAIIDHITQLVNNTTDKIWISQSSSYSLCSLIPSSRRIKKLCPIQLMKAVKNEVEIAGMRNAHIKCAVALCEYFCWIEKQLMQGNSVNELMAAEKLEEFRKEQDLYVSPSFSTISSSGPNGAVIHYSPTKETSRSLSLEEPYLCDAGCQFRDGTTDVTRTMHFGTPSEKQRECLTLVLKGNIALCTSVFPNKTHGSKLDAFARLPLWSAGLDYRHGTGHGVGAFLNVHEGPSGIGGSKGCPEPLQANMILSDEPGYYEDGEFGCRVENLVLIKSAETKYNFGDKPYLTMEPLTLVPIQLKMVVPELLSDQEISWINSYHTRCREEVGTVLLEQGKAAVHQWMLKETQLIG